MKAVDLKEHPNVKRIVLAAFPSYRKHRVFITDFYPLTINSYWDGGSRDEFAIVNCKGESKLLPTATHPYYDVKLKGENQDVHIDSRGNITLKKLPKGFYLVKAGTFMGKPATAVVYGLENYGNSTIPDPRVQALL